MALVLTGSSPAANAAAAPRTGAISLTFSAPIDASTLGASTVSLTSAAGTEAVTYSVSGNTVTLTPAAPIRRALVYIVTARPGLKGSAGEVVAAPIFTTFTTVDGVWAAPQVLGNNTGYAPTVRLDKAGGALAVWLQPQPSLSTLFDLTYARMTSAGTWGTAAAVGDDVSSCCPSLAVAADGSAVLAWVHEEPSYTFTVKAAHFTLANGWEAPVSLRPAQQYGYASALAATNSAGDSFVTFAQADDMFANGRPAGGSWGATSRFDPSPRLAANNLSIGADDVGGAFSLSTYSIVGNYSPYIAFNSGGVWGSPTLIPGVSDASPALAAGDAQGNIWVVFAVSVGTDLDVEAIRYTKSGGWNSPVSIEAMQGYAWPVSLCVAADGSVVVVWEDGPGSTQRIWASRYSPATGWAAAEKLQPTDDFVVTARSVVDSGGNAIVAWEQSSTIWMSRYVVGKGWTAEVVDSGQQPDLSINAEGKAVLAYSHSTGTSWQIKARVFN